MKINIKRIITVILTILVILTPCFAVENRDFFVTSLILWPIFAIALAILKVMDVNKIDYKKANAGLILHKLEDKEEDNLSEALENLKVTNNATEGLEEK